MRPTFEMLAFQLSKSWSLHVKQPKQSMGQLSLPLLYESAMPMNENHVYIAKAEDLPALSPPIDECCIICCNGEPEELYNNSGCGLIVINSSINLAQAVNRVQFIYSLYQDWEEHIQKIVETNGSLQELLDSSSVVFENLLCLIDENINYLAASSHGKRVDDNALPMDVFNNKITIQSLTQANKKVANNRYLFDLKNIQNLNDAYELFFIRFFYGKIDIGALCIFPTEHKLQEHDRQLLDILSSYVEVLLLRPSQFEDESLKNLLAALITGASIKAEDISILEAALNLEPMDKYCCIVIQLPANVISISGRYLQRRIKVEMPESVTLAHKSHLILLLNETKANLSKERLQQLLKNWLGKSDYIAGISDSFSYLDEVQDYYQEAKSVVKFAGSGSSRVVTIKDCWDRIVLTNCTRNLPAKMLFPSGFRQLIEYNKTSAVDYLKTLRIYLEEGKNDTRTAARLFICRNSFLYRLEKLTSILGEDLDDPDVRFRLELCLRLNDMVSKQQD